MFSKKTIYILVLLLSACQLSPTYELTSYENNLIKVQTYRDSSLVKIIQPYKDSIESQMNEILSYTRTNLEKGRPQSTIGNFVTDLCLNYSDADMCVMNNGGLRTTIPKGNITRGKLYELMPFENELVVLELDKKDYLDLLNYITKRGGEPFSGIKITTNKNGKIISNSWPVNFEKGEKVKVLTSDYLANGGDNMQFFQNKKQSKIGLKLRDAIIDYCIKKDTINIIIDDRILVLNNEK